MRPADRDRYPALIPTTLIRAADHAEGGIIAASRSELSTFDSISVSLEGNIVFDIVIEGKIDHELQEESKRFGIVYVRTLGALLCAKLDPATSASESMYLLRKLSRQLLWYM